MYPNQYRLDKAKANLKRLLRRMAQSFQLTENGILLGLAVIVGVSTAFGVWVFRGGITFFHRLFFDNAAHDFLPFGDFNFVIIMAVAGLIVGYIAQFWVGKEQFHGVATIIQSVALVGGRLPYRKMPAKSLGAAISIGGGASVGTEDPSVQIGAHLGSFFGQWLKLTEDRVRLLVAAGAASAIASAFNAPIAGVFFALEIILGNFATNSVGVVVLSAVMSSVVTQSIDEAGPELGIRSYELGDISQVPFYIILGLLAAPVAAAFIRSVFYQSQLWHRWQVPLPFKTALAGIIVGACGVYFPEILGAGHEPMNEVLNTGAGDFTIQFLMLLVVLKIIMTSVSMAGGFMGGIFAPSLFVGAMLGGAYGRFVSELFPNAAIGDPAAYAIAGMAAMLAGVVRAPITAILLPFEMTNNYQLILPIMLSTVVTTFLTERFEPDGIYAKALKKAGISIQQGRDVDIMQSVMVREVMRTPPPVISPDATLTELRDAFRQNQTKAVCVIKNRHHTQRLLGIVTLTDLQTAYETARAAQLDVQLTVGDICNREVVVITPNEPVYVAIARMGRHDYGHLPVVADDNDRILIGLLTRNDILRSYNIAVARKWETQYQSNQIKLQNLVNEDVLSLIVPQNAHIAEKQVHEIKWPPNVILVSIRRKNKIIHPHGSTVIQGGDKLTLVASPDEIDRVKGIINAPSLKSMNLEE